MATKIKLTVQTNFDQAGAELSKFGQLTEKEAKRIEAGLKRLNNFSADAFVEQNRRAGAAITATRGRLEGLKSSNLALQRKMEMLIRNGMDPQSEALQRLRREYTANAEAIQRMEQQQEDLNKSMEAGKRIAQGLGLAIAATAAYGTKSQAEYAKEIANVNTLIDISQKEFTALDKSIEKLSVDFATQKKELSGGIYQAVSAGAADLSEALDIVTQSATLGRAALIDNATSVDIITTAMNAYGKEVVSASKASDIYFQTIKKGKINGEELSATIGQSISLFANAKLPIEDLGAGIATLTKVGVKASESTTQLNGVVNAFLKPSEAMADAIARTNYESGEALLKAEGLSGAMNFLQRETNGSSAALATLMPNIRGMRGAMALMSEEGAVLNNVLADFASNRVSGASEEALKKQTDGFAKNVFSVEQSVIALQNLAMVIGERVLPILGKFARFITNMVTDFSNLNGPTKFLLRAIPMLTASMTAFLISMNIGTIVSAAITSLSALGTAITTLGTLIAANPVGAFAVSLAAISTAVTIGVTEQIEKSADAVGKWASAGSKDMKMMMGLLRDYETLRNTPKQDLTKADKKSLKDLEKQIESITGGTLKWDKETQKASINFRGGIKQDAEMLERFSNAKDKNAAKRLEQLAAETEALRKAEEQRQKEAEAAYKAEQAKRKEEAKTAAAREKLLEEANKLKDDLRIADLLRGKTELEKETTLIELEYKKQSELLKKFYSGDTQLLLSLQADRDDKLKAAREQAKEKEDKVELKDRLASEESLYLESNKRIQDEMVAHFETLAELKGEDTETKIARLLEEQARIRELETLTREEKLQAEIALSSALEKIQEESTKKAEEAARRRMDSISMMVSNTSKLFGALDKIMENSGKKSRELAIIQKALAIATIGIDTARAFTKTLVDGGPYPLNTINAGIVAAAGVAQGIAVATTPIPSAETGGSFEATMPGTQRTDGAMVAVNPGENLEVTPRGEENNKSITAKVILNDQVLWESTQRGIDSGEITFTNANLVG